MDTAVKRAEERQWRGVLRNYGIGQKVEIRIDVREVAESPLGICLCGSDVRSSSG